MSSCRVFLKRMSALAVLAFLGGCTGDGRVQAAAWGGAIDTLDGVITVSNPATPSWSAEDAWRLEEDLSIGEVEGDANYEFASIRHLEVDEHGNIYVLDAQAHRISVYDAVGLFLTSFGHQGEGPGEFKFPNRLIWRADTLAIWDWDLRRLSYFDRAGNLLRDERLELPFFVSEFAFRPDGRLWVQRGPAYSVPARPETDGIGWLLEFDLADQVADTVIRWMSESSFAVRSDNFGLVLPRMYAPSLEWTMHEDGRLFVARGQEFVIDVYATDLSHVETIRREYTRHPPSAAEVDRALAWIDERAERFGQNADRVRKAYQVPDLKPATGALHLSDDGYLWVRAYTEDDSSRESWDVFDVDGRYLGRVDAPARLSIYRITDAMLYGVLPDEFDVPQVKRYAIVRPT